MSILLLSAGEQNQTKLLSFDFCKAIDGKPFPRSCLTGFNLISMYHSSATRSAFYIDPFVKGISKYFKRMFVSVIVCGYESG